MTVEGTAHSIAMLDDDMQGRILNFYARTLAGLDPGEQPDSNAEAEPSRWLERQPSA